MAEENPGSFNSPNINGLIASLAPNASASVLSSESIAYLRKLIKQMKGDESLSDEFLRCIRENISLQIIAPTDRMVDFFREWLALPTGFSGDFEREKLRTKIRSEFPILPRHYRAIAVEVGSNLHLIEQLGHSNQSSVALARTVQGAYAYCRWLSDPGVPPAPTEASIMLGQAIVSLGALQGWLIQCADAMERKAELLASPKVVASIDELEKTITSLDTGNGQWIKNSEAAKREGLETSTLATYRRNGIMSTDKMFGKDPDGRIWRRAGTPNSHPWYFRSTLKSVRNPG